MKEPLVAAQARAVVDQHDRHAEPAALAVSEEEPFVWPEHREEREAGDEVRQARQEVARIGSEQHAAQPDRPSSGEWNDVEGHELRLPALDLDPGVLLHERGLVPLL